MTICKFYQNGNCRNGNNCRFEHVNAGGGNNYRNTGQNRFGALSGGNNNHQSQNPGDKYNITSDAIERDLTLETPQWILSAYAPGRDAPEQLFGGYPREQSFEEMRLHFMTGKASGNEQQALNEAQQLYSNAQQQMENAARNTQDAIQFLVSAENKIPNRLTICRDGTQGAPFGEFLVGKRPKSLVPDTSAPSNPFGGNNNNNNNNTNTNTSSPFGGASNTQGSAFGQPSALGQRPSAFGTPSFGAPSQPAAPSSAFGQPSALGAKPNPFGTPSFGTPSQPGNSGSAFGQTSQLGQKPNPFAASSNTGNSQSPFASSGNNNGAPNNNQSPFASASNNNNNNNNNNNGLAPSPFGAPSGTQAPSPFSSNNNAQNNNTSSPFGQPSQVPSPFAQNNNSGASNPFASGNQGPNASNGNPFAQAQQPATGFANQPNQQQANNPFNSTPMSNMGQQNQAQKPAAGTGSPYPPGSARQHPPIDSYSSKGMDGRLSMFKGKPVSYQDDKPGIRGFDGTWRRIWFPDGAPNYTKDTELPPDQYDEKSKAQWAAFQQTGTFQDGLMPELPPPRECTVWDF